MHPNVLVLLKLMKYVLSTLAMPAASAFLQPHIARVRYLTLIHLKRVFRPFFTTFAPQSHAMGEITLFSIL